jgi:hypothetical protein
MIKCLLSERSEFKISNLTKTLLFCTNFLRKITKINISKQLLCFVILCATFQTHVKHIVHKQSFNNVNRCCQQCLKSIIL